MVDDGAGVELRRIPIDLIDEPPIAMRETMSDEGIEALALSLKTHGQLQNVGVVVDGDRYRIAYGHRRRIAAARAGLTHLVCRVWPEGTPDEEAIKVDENAEQEPVNAAAEATYYRQLLDERCGGDVDKLCRLVRKKESHVLARLDLTRGDPDVLAALRAGAIGVQLAIELNKVAEPMYRALFLHDAVEQGLSVKAVRALRQNRDRDRRIAEQLASPEMQAIAPSTQPAIENMDACVLCRSASDQHEITYVRVHRSCLSVYNRDERGGQGGQ
jgi:ParB/RepB/Spo0J family partition protein